MYKKVKKKKLILIAIDQSTNRVKLQKKTKTKLCNVLEIVFTYSKQEITTLQIRGRYSELFNIEREY